MFQIACFSVPPVNPREKKHFWAYLNLTAASFKYFSPEIRTLLLTTKRAKIPKGLVVDRVQRLPESMRLKKGLMVDEFQGWLEFVKSDLFDRPTILVDPDLVLQRDPSAVFEEDFDVGLTWRDISGFAKPKDFNEHANTQQINAGVIFLNPKRKEAVVHFFEKCVVDLLSLNPDFWQWYGDQESLQRVSDVGDEFEYQPEIKDVDGVRIRQFLCDEYNFSAPNLPNGNPNTAEFSDPYIVHFKGFRKQIMFPYAAQYLGIRMQQDKKAPGGVKIFLS